MTDSEITPQWLAERARNVAGKIRREGGLGSTERAHDWSWFAAEIERPTRVMPSSDEAYQ